MKISGIPGPASTVRAHADAAPAQTDTASSGSTAWTCAVSASESTPRTSDSRSWIEPFPVFVLHLNDFFISMMYRFVVQENRNV